MLRFILLILAFSLPVISKPTNLEIQDSLIKISVKEIISNLNTNHQSVNIKIQNHSAGWLLNQNLANHLIKNDFTLNDSASTKIEVFLKRIEPEYTLLNQDSTERSIEIIIAYNIIEHNDIIFSEEINNNYNDFN
jgi:hypothetical protein